MGNRVCEVLGIEKPVIQGPMAWCAFAPLVAAVSNAGGFGVLGVASAPNELVREQIHKTRELTDKPFGVNVFMIPPLVEAVLPVLIEERPAAVYADILFDLDPELCKVFFTPLKAAGIKVIVKASTLKDAMVAEEAGADLVIAKGWEGGGHVTPEATMALLPLVTQALSIPVVGSGGIADGRGMAAAIALGADGIEMGTRFLCSEECPIHQNAKDAILAQQDNQSVIILSSIMEPCRQIPNAFSDELLALEANNPVKDVEGILREKFGPCLKNGMHDGDTEGGSVMSGMIAPLVTEIKPAAEIIDTVIAECKEVIARSNSFEF